MDTGKAGPQRIATVFNASGKLVLAYAGRKATPVTDGDCREWALNHRTAKTIIGAMLTLQIMMLGTLLWL